MDIKLRTCLVCGANIEDLSPKARYCSAACKTKAYRQGKTRVKARKSCAFCGKSFLGAGDSIYCSKQCNQKAYAKRNPDKRRATYQKYKVSKGLSKTVYREGMKNTCQICGKSFAPDKFHPYQKNCSSCQKAASSKISVAWWKKNPSRAKAIMRKYDRSEKAKEKRKRRYDVAREYQKEWLKRNPEKTAEYSKSYREKNPENAKLSRKKYYGSHKGKLLNRTRSRCHTARVRKDFDHKIFLPIMDKQGYACPLCGADYGSDLENMHIGHIVPISKNRILASDPSNQIPICKKCNLKMHNTVFDKYCMKNDLPIPKRVLQFLNKQEKLDKYGLVK